MAFEEDGVAVTLAGQVTECDYASPDGEEGYYSIMLVVDGDEEYVVEPDSRGDRLEDFIDRWVEVKGDLYEIEDSNILVIHEFEAEDDTIPYDEDR